MTAKKEREIPRQQSTFVEALKDTTNQLLQQVHLPERFRGKDGKYMPDRNEMAKERLRTMRHVTARSKSGVWGPSHSFDSEDELEVLNKTSGEESGGTNTTQEESFSHSHQNRNSAEGDQSNSHPKNVFQCAGSGDNDGFLSGMWNTASTAFNDILAGDCIGACHNIDRDAYHNKNQRRSKKSSNWHSSSSSHGHKLRSDRLSPPSKEISFRYQRSNASSLTEGNIKGMTSKHHDNEIGDDDARMAAKLMAAKNKLLSSNLSSKATNITKKCPDSPRVRKFGKNQAPPFNFIAINTMVKLENSISELTMKSCRGEAVTPVSDMRRMAYYAVFKNHAKKGVKGEVNGGNRRCYYTGNPIVGGRPFYAGSVQQGLRTLIVFCLPSALGLPKRENLERVSELELNSQNKTNDLSRRVMTGLSTAALSQHDSIYSGDGFVMSELFHSSAWQEDEDGNLCESLNVDFIIQALPDPNRELLASMQETFPEQFASLNPRLRRPQCWRLYVKFCFFSGLPIADGEMYYKVMDDVVKNYSKNGKKMEEIALSHEVMEAVSGESAELLRLPSKKTFEYLQKHYKQQCAKFHNKLSKKVFDRSSWIRVMPEI